MTATDPTEPIPKDAQRLLQLLAGQTCTMQRIGSDRSLFIGFGDIDNSSAKPHARTEIGTYDCAWRICREGRVLCGRDDVVDEVMELQECLSSIELGEFIKISQTSEFDVRIQFSTGVWIDVLCTISDDDEVLHIFFPDKEVMTFRPVEGWRFGKSDEPWT